MINWQNYYTPELIATHIIGLIPDNFDPYVVIDICVGSGNFLNAAAKRWEKAEFLGLDLSPINESINDKFIIKKGDALDFRNLIDFKRIANKLVLANPPFGKTYNYEFQKCDRHYKLQKLAQRSNRIEAQMLISNLFLLNDGDLFAAVIPENIFSAEKMKNFKSLFFSYFECFFMGEPERYFKGSEVKTRIFIGVYKNNNVDFESSSDKHSSKDLSVNIFRGIDNSKLCDEPNEENNFSVIHFTTLSESSKLLKYSNKKFLRGEKIEANDVLISRVGRNAGRVYLAEEKFIGHYVSDYFYVLKNMKNIKSEAGWQDFENNVQNNKKGLTARYITKKDIFYEILKA